MKKRTDDEAKTLLLLLAIVYRFSTLPSHFCCVCSNISEARATLHICKEKEHIAMDLSKHDAKHDQT